MRPTHPDPDVAEALHAWGVKPGSLQESQSEVLFPTFDALRDFFVTVLPEDFHHNFHRYRAVHAGSTPYDLGHILTRVSELDLFPAQFTHAAVYINLLSYADPDRKPSSRRQMYEVFGKLSLITAPYAKEAFEGQVAGWRGEDLIGTLFDTVKDCERSGIPAAYIRGLDLLVDQANWDAPRIKALYRYGVAAEYAAQFPSWDASSILTFSNQGIAAAYVDALAPLPRFGGPRVDETRAVYDIAVLHHAAVPSDYAAHGKQAGLDATTVIGCHNRGIPSEYLGVV